MANFCDQTDQIKTLISSDSKLNKSLAYSTLLHLQQQSNDLPSSLQTLADYSQSLISLIAVDISDNDEEIAAQALKCLGFMIYHPSIVATIPDDDVNTILEALAKVIIATKIKSVCNLGVWCISMQQFDASFLANHFNSMLLAVVHALDNPFGSLSTTFEAIQVIMKLASQLSEKMRESSHIWAPPIYRRLLSTDKRERDMSERCLLKIKAAIFPPSSALSKAFFKDMKWKLLAGMKDLLKQGMKVQALQAWGWFIRLLGSHALKNRHLINDMLKIPEQTFSDHSPQVQIASQVAWEGLVDALIDPPMISCEPDKVVETSMQHLQSTGEIGCQVQSNAFSKSIKLLMTPLVGIIASKCDISVHLSCLNTWFYLLHKLDIFVNCPLVIELVLDPVCEAVFAMGPDMKASWLWSLCLALLDDFVITKCGKVDHESSSQVRHHSSVRSSMLGPSLSGKCLIKQQYSIKWFPWGISQLNFFIKMINIILSHVSITTIAPQDRSSAFDSALRIFSSLLRGVQVELKSSSINYADTVLCLNTILRFINETCEKLNSGDVSNDKLHYSIPFLQAVVDELEPSILGSPLYKVALDLRFIEILQSVGDTKYEKFLDIISIGYGDMVSPLSYLIVLGTCLVINSTSDMLRKELIPQGLHNFFAKILFSYDPLKNFQVAIGLLYKYGGYRNLYIWIEIAEVLEVFIGSKDLSLLQMEPDSSGYLGMYHFLTYPFVAWCSPQQTLAPEKVTGSSEENVSASNLDLEHVIEVWRSVYGALCSSRYSATINISENLCSMLNCCIDENINLSKINCDTELDLGCKDLDLDIISLFGNAVACILEVVLAASSEKNNKSHAEPQISSDIRNTMGFTSRFLKLSWTKRLADSPVVHPVISRVLSALARFISCLHFKQSILSVIEIMTCPVLQWLSHGAIHDGSTNYQLQHLWAEILDCLRRSYPPIVFDSSFLKFQAPFLEKTLDHPDSIISGLTISFWNSTYGEQAMLHYPENLLDILDKLSRNKRINLDKKSLPFLVKCNSYLPELTAQGYKVAATNSGSSKRVEFVEDIGYQLEHKDQLCSSSKRKRLELTEHQKEVRRAQ